MPSALESDVQEPRAANFKHDGKQAGYGVWAVPAEHPRREVKLAYDTSTMPYLSSTGYTTAGNAGRGIAVT